MKKYRSYKFTNKQHSKGGVRSSIAAAAALLCTAISLFAAYTAKGEAGKSIVFLGVAAMIGSIYGVIVGRNSFREEECYYVFSHIGTGVNLVLVLFWLVVIGLGVLA